MKYCTTVTKNDLLKAEKTLTYLIIISETTIHYYESVRVMHFSNYFITSAKIYLEKFCDHYKMYVGVVYINFVEFFAKLVSVIIAIVFAKI